MVRTTKWLTTLVATASIVMSIETLALTVKVEATTQGDLSKPEIVGKTNLPPGTDLLLILRRDSIDYKAEVSAVVAPDGSFKGGPFSYHNAPLVPGRYQIEVLMPVSAGQPGAVQAVIGRYGENIAGPSVQQGPRGLGKVVDYRVPLVVPGQTDPKNEAQLKQSEQATTQAYLERTCYENIDTANRLVDEGKLIGPKIEGAQRQKKINDCLREMRKP
jgi:hypothetical protein